MDLYYRMAQASMTSIINAVFFLLFLFFILVFPKQIYRYVKYLLGKNEEYRIVNFVLFIIPNILFSFILSLVIYLVVYNKMEYELYDYSIYSIAAAPPVLCILLFIRKRIGMHRFKNLPDESYIRSTQQKPVVKVDVVKDDVAKDESVAVDSAAENMKYCKHCGKLVTKSSVFCKYCGTKLN